MAYGWESERVRLVPVEKDKHFENCLRWVNDHEITRHLCIGYLPMNRQREEAWFETLGDENKVIYAIELLDGTHIGQSGIEGIDWHHRTATTGSFIGEEKYQGVGYGREAAILRAWVAFNVLGLRLLKSGYLGNNRRSERMQKAVGYIEFGRLPEALWKLGEYKEHVYTYLTRERFEEVHPGYKPKGF